MGEGGQLIIVLAHTHSYAELVLSHLHYPRHHGTIMTDMEQMRGHTIWTPMLVLPGANQNSQYDNIMAHARAQELCIYHLIDDRDRIIP